MPESTWIPAPGRIPPTVAAVLLESLRALDTPPEELVEHEDLPDIASALPHRLGLSPAVEDQIHRYTRRKSDLPAREVASLIRLIGRRPDARSVFEEAGRRLARRDMNGRRIGARLRRRTLPTGVRYRLALRRLRHLARRLNPGAEVRTERKPPALIVERCLPAHAAESDAGCALLAGAMECVLEAYGAEAEVRHPSCEGRRDGSCVWKLEDRAG